MCAFYNAIPNDPIAGYPHVCILCDCCNPPVRLTMHPPTNTKGQFFTNAHGQHVKEHKPGSKMPPVQVTETTDKLGASIMVAAAEQEQRDAQQQEVQTLMSKYVSDIQAFEELAKRVDRLESKLRLMCEAFRSLTEALA